MVRVRLVANVLLATLLAAMLAGCSAPKATVNDDGAIKTNSFEVDPNNKTHGYVTGTVLTEAGNPVPGARVTILSVETSAMTDPKGEFNFTGVAKGAQDLRVEKDGYKTLQRPFIVEAGKIIEVEVILARADGLDGGMIDHYHDHWRGQALYTIYEEQLEYDTDVTQVPPTFCGAWRDVAATEGCDGAIELIPAEGRIVPPGTSKITVDLAFEPGPMFDHESIRFSLYPPPAPDGITYSAQSWDITTGTVHLEYELPAPDVVDFGHARYTNWVFTFSHFSQARYQTWASAYNLLFNSPVDITITAHKGSLLIDPPHPRHWEDAASLPMPAGEPGSFYCALPQAPHFACNDRTPNPGANHGGPDVLSRCFPGCMVISSGGLVPLDSTRITFDLEMWTAGFAGGEPPWEITGRTDWVLGYKPANAPWREATWQDYTWIEPLETYEPAPVDGRYGAQGQRHEIFVEPGQEDEFYTVFSHWIFMMAVRGHEDANDWSHIACSTDTCGYPYFEMKNVVVHNDSKGTEEA